MTVTDVEHTEREVEDSPRTVRFSQLLRLLAILIPVGLFAASILVSLGFWVSLDPLYGEIAAWLAIAGMTAAILAMFFFRKE